jgi:hypothetical protein
VVRQQLNRHFVAARRRIYLLKLNVSCFTLTGHRSRLNVLKSSNGCAGWAVTLVLPALFLLSSCSTNNSTTASEELVIVASSLQGAPAKDPSSDAGDRPPPSVSLQAPPQPSPLDALRLSPGENRFVYDAWQALAKQCMEAKGFSYYVAAFEVVDARPRLSRTMDEVEANGYNPISEPLPAEALETVAAVEGDPAYRRAYVGDEQDLTDGCRDRALLVTDPADGEYQQLDTIIENAKIEALLEVESTPEYKALNTRWSDCMSALGYDFGEPGDALSRFVGTAVDQQQIDARIADLNCQAEIRYVGLLDLLEAEASSRWIDNNQDVVGAIAGAKKRYLAELAEYTESAGLAVQLTDG